MLNDYQKIEISEAELEPSRGSSLSYETRKKILQMYKAGCRKYEIRNELELTEHQVRRVLTPGYQGGRGHKKSEQVAEKIVPQVEEKPEKKYTYSERALISEEAKKYDPTATADDCLDDLRRLQEANPYRWITRTAYRAEGSYSESTWVRYFGTFQQFRQSAGIEPTRYQGAIEKAIAKHASLDHYVKFHAEKVLPWCGKYARKSLKNERDLMVVSDVHSLHADPFATMIFFDTLKRIKPTRICINGDLDDGYVFSRYEVDPREADLTAEIAWCRWFLNSIREICPDAEIDFNLGNHEWRVLRHVADASPYLKELLADVLGHTIGDIYGVDDYEINVNCKWDFKAFKQQDIKDQIAKNYIIYDDMFAVTHIQDPKFMTVMSGTSGHTHKPRILTSRNPIMDHTSWTTTGCLCKLDPVYTPDMDESMQGFAYFQMIKNKHLVLPELFLIPGDVACVAGKLYYR